MKTDSLSVVVGWVFWMMAGPMCLVLLALTIIQSGSGWATAADAGYFAVLAGMVAARRLEFRSGNPRTADGRPATPAHLRRYVQATIPLGVGMWAVANVVGNHLLR